MRLACYKTSEHAPSHGREPLELDQDAEVFLSRINLRLQPQDVLELRSNRSSNFPNSSLRLILGTARTYSILAKPYKP